MTPRLGVMILRETLPEDEVALSLKLAPHVEEIWIVEDLEYAGGISQIASILEATANAGHEVVVGHGIAPAPFRNPAALAMEWATICRMYPGRLRCGIGHGLQTWMGEIGEGVESPLRLFRETLESVRSIMSGNKTTVDGQYVKLDGVELKFPPTDLPGLLSGVTGPRSLALSGEIADGTILSEGFGPEKVRWARGEIDKGREAAGRSDHHDLTVFVGFYCGDLDQLGPPPDLFEPPEFEVVGPTVDAVLPELQALVDAGVDAITLIAFGPDPEQQVQLTKEEIWPRLVSSTPS